MNSRELKSHVLPWLLGGRHRTEMPRFNEILCEDDPRAALKALGLAGQASRFDRAAMPGTFVVETWPHDERRIIPERLRRAILRLLDNEKCTDDTEIRLAWMLANRRLRPHPFDLPRMDAFIHKYAQHLGITAQYWAQRDDSAERRPGYFDAEQIDEKNWAEAPVGRRVRFLEQLRERDPGVGRLLLERVWAEESAQSRLRLLATMQTGLSREDIVFLQGLVKDRATRVKALANRLLARASGSGFENQALAACLGRIQKSKAGLMRRRNALKLELPANIKAPAVDRWVRDLVEDVGLEELAAALQTTDVELVEAAEKDEHLVFALVIITSREKRLDLLTRLVEAMPEAWSRMSQAGFDDIAFVYAGEREQWITTVVRPKLYMPEDALPSWSWLLRRSEGPLPASIMNQILDSIWWAAQLNDDSPPTAALVQVFCALCAPEVRGTLRPQLGSIPCDRKEAGLLLLEILDELESIA